MFKLSDLGLSVRLLNCLLNNGIEYVNDLPCKATLRRCASLSGYQLRAWKNFGMKSYREIIDTLSDNGIEYK